MVPSNFRKTLHANSVFDKQERLRIYATAPSNQHMAPPSAAAGPGSESASPPTPDEALEARMRETLAATASEDPDPATVPRPGAHLAPDVTPKPSQRDPGPDHFILLIETPVMENGLEVATTYRVATAYLPSAT